jgi:ribosome-binding factor A
MTSIRLLLLYTIVLWITVGTWYDRCSNIYSSGVHGVAAFQYGGSLVPSHSRFTRCYHARRAPSAAVNCPHYQQLRLHARSVRQDGRDDADSEDEDRGLPPRSRKRMHADKPKWKKSTNNSGNVDNSDNLSSGSVSSSLLESKFHRNQIDDTTYQRDLRRSLRKQKLARLIRDELSAILWSNDIRSTSGSRPSEDIFRATVVSEVQLNEDCSQADISVATMQTPKTESTDETTTLRPIRAVDKRMMFVWLVQHVHLVRHELAQRLSHLRRIPRLRFVRNTLDDRSLSGSKALDVLAVLDKL